MKKILLIMMTFMASFGAFAQEVNTENEISACELSIPYTLLSVVSVNQSDLVLPWTFSVPAPYETVAEAYGPYTHPNLYSWNVQNGYLTITIPEDAFPEITQKGEHHFTVRTVNSTLYTIVLEVR